MSSQPTPDVPRQLVFGPYAFSSASTELTKYGVRVRLQGQPLQILAALLREPGTIVTREAFHQRLWESSTFVDFEHGLNAAVNRLRQVLGDSAERPRYIETIPGRGYRFIAPTQDAVSKPVLVVTPASAPIDVGNGLTAVTSLPKRMFSPWWIAAGVLAGLAGGYLAAHRAPVSSLAQPVRFGISPPNGYALESGSSRQTFALSPDGTRLAFTAMDTSGVFQTFIRDLDALDSRPLANSVGSYSVFWAPDSRSLFLTLRGNVQRSDFQSDSYQALCDTPTIMLIGAVMSPNMLISTRFANYTVPLRGGTPQKIKELYPWPQVLPDGKHILYTVFDPRLGHHRARMAKYGEPGSAIDLLETDSRTIYAASVLTPETGHLLYVRAGNLLAQPFDPRSLKLMGEPAAFVSQIYTFFPTGAADFSVSNNGTLAYRRYLSRSQLAWVARDGKTLRTIGPTNVNVKHARLSPDGSKIASPIFDVSRGVNDMWIIDSVTGAARKTIVGSGVVDNPVWSPDSRKLAFNRAYASSPKLFVRGIGESESDEPMPEDFFQVPTDWSSDGRFIAFTNTGFAQIENEMRGDVWLIDMARNRKVVHLIRTPFHEANAAFSPDGHWLAFTSNESGRTEVYVQAFEASESPRLTGARHLVSRHGAIALRWRRDGKELFYLAWDGRLYATPISLSPKPRVGEPVPLFSISTEARAAMHSTVGFDVSADGQQLLVPIVASSEKSEIVVVHNWEGLLERNLAHSR